MSPIIILTQNNFIILLRLNQSSEQRFHLLCNSVLPNIDLNNIDSYEQSDKRIVQRTIHFPRAFPSIGFDFLNGSEVDTEQQPNHNQIANGQNNKVPNFQQPYKADVIDSVPYLKREDDEARNDGFVKEEDEGQDYARTNAEVYESVVAHVPFL